MKLCMENVKDSSSNSVGCQHNYSVAFLGWFVFHSVRIVYVLPSFSCRCAIDNSATRGCNYL